MKSLNIYVCLIVENEDSLWHRQFSWTLKKRGHSVFTPPATIGIGESWNVPFYNWGNAGRKKLSEDILEDITTKHKKNGLDVCLLYLFPFQFEASLLKKIEKLGIPCVYFFCDNFYYPNVAKEYAPQATLNWVPEYSVLDSFKDSKSNYIYLPMAANPVLNFPVSVSKRRENIAFVGYKREYRVNLLYHLAKEKLPLELYGSGWKKGLASHLDTENPPEIDLSKYAPMPPLERFKVWLDFKKSAFRKRVLGENTNIKPIYDNNFQENQEQKEEFLNDLAVNKILEWEDVNKLYAESAITLGVNDNFIKDKKGNIVNHPKMRDFEVTMSGACYLTLETPESRDLFEADKEVCFYNNPEELIEKSNFLLKNETLRNSMRIAAHERAMKDHTWEERFKKLFERLNLEF
ncbi:glycosyltransferase [Bernardetia sp. OM2101]|uniref:glycosyltransferase family protein n=1 Tax=Bernardetia sp. OM2101 TaxID=3344876 RepID=UPI0035CEE096